MANLMMHSKCINGVIDPLVTIHTTLPQPDRMGIDTRKRQNCSRPDVRRKVNKYLNGIQWLSRTYDKKATSYKYVKLIPLAPLSNIRTIALHTREKKQNAIYLKI